MKKIIFIPMLLLFISCGNVKSAYEEELDLGAKVRGLMFECDFKDECFFKKMDELLDKECKSYKKFSFSDKEKCKLFYDTTVRRAYAINKRTFGKEEESKEEEPKFLGAVGVDGSKSP